MDTYVTAEPRGSDHVPHLATWSKESYEYYRGVGHRGRDVQVLVPVQVN